MDVRLHFCLFLSHPVPEQVKIQACYKSMVYFTDKIFCIVIILAKKYIYQSLSDAYSSSDSYLPSSPTWGLLCPLAPQESLYWSLLETPLQLWWVGCQYWTWDTRGLCIDDIGAICAATTNTTLSPFPSAATLFDSTASLTLTPLGELLNSLLYLGPWWAPQLTVVPRSCSSHTTQQALTFSLFHLGVSCKTWMVSRQEWT